MSAPATRVATLIALAAFACSGREPAGGSGDGADDSGDARRVQVVFNDPYCDICTQADKDALKPGAPITRAIVDLIDRAEQTVDAAQFTFSVREIEDALVRAHQRGVAVRVAIDAAQAEGDTAAVRLAAAGIDVAFVAGKPGQGDHPAGLQHAKFVIVDGAALATGSNNWSSTGTTINEESTIVIESSTSDPQITAFRCHFQAMFDGKLDDAGNCSAGEVTFAPSTRPIALIRDAIRGSTRSVDVMMHHFLFTDLVKELAKAAERGVRVRVVVNAADRAEVAGQAWDRLRAAGGQIRFKQTNGDLFQIMHHKLAIIDDRVLVNGSGNWSGSAFFNNYENYVLYRDPQIVRPYLAQFWRLWSWSLTGESLDAGVTASAQHASSSRIAFGNLHAHFFARDDSGRLMDDGQAQRVDPAGAKVEVEVGDSVAASARFAFEYARDRGDLDFMVLSPHVTDDAADQAPDAANITPERFAELAQVAAAVTTESAGGYVAIAGMEWNTNSLGNHVNVIGSRALSRIKRDRFDLLYDQFLPGRALAGDFPVIQLNHPRTFRHFTESVDGNWDQVFDLVLTEIAKVGERNKKFNDYGIDDYPPLADVRAGWIEGTELPDRAIVDQALAAVEAASRPYARIMEVLVSRGTEFGAEEPQNPSLAMDDTTGEVSRFTRVHSDWDYYLAHGFRLAPAANHDNHMANWGTGHTSRTAVFADRLDETEILTALDLRQVYASEDQNLELRFYAGNRVPMGGELGTLASSVGLQIDVRDPDYDGPITARVFLGKIGTADVTAVAEITDLTEGALRAIDVPLGTPGVYFAYVEIHELAADRMAWSAPIWIIKR